MARKSAKSPGNEEEVGNVPSQAKSLARIANLLGLIAVKGEDESEKARTLDAAGFETAEIAALLGKTPNNISVLLYKLRKRRKG